MPRHCPSIFVVRHGCRVDNCLTGEDLREEVEEGPEIGWRVRDLVTILVVGGATCLALSRLLRLSESEEEDSAAEGMS